ncbi:hypothetical protein I307_01942 [Cryptococcus deuterogattii 99/473]|uniref:Uncharacterized protein n=2 Tax=Cryptococcus deuterogattii TaxID=1859096 RepID=A0A0D0TWX3_9TREE|nr:hypothetical protein CNBG_1743 [Cryptococcus deuterogattii R265]KIR35203.1 hypothetical protein I352_02472 [Cryptococcus deuterogattii MMRL2647]KIR40388.1 hypothetical protein I313_03712 [Cryptococcus deuterogattii Ram5]KIR72100.1 hypothetical protein I310_04152 [Cryptococcus deuterogattii CA1014]KIR99929.1 hypothetical protein L804_02565 [Cryptococcus deuterogattii 2001/935-1]KIY58629.1 hypothetical protein I307_01942 [Cryptococcus deuterogattii 99/473]
MSLSSSTLSLKFMQRGLARAAASTPQQQRGDSKPSSSAGPSTPTPAAAGNSNDRPEEVSQALAREEQAKWFIPRQNRSTAASTSWIRDGGVQVKFEASYAPFLPGYEESQDEEDKDVFETQAGGGRMAFGGFGKAKGKEKAEGEEGEGDADYDERMEEDEEVKNKRAKPITKKKPATKEQPKTFLRPALSPPPSQPKPTSNHPNSSNAPQISQKKSAKRPPPESPAKPSTSSVSKKAKVESGTNAPKKNGSTSKSTGVGKTLDERQKILKAQKKAEKKKAKTQQGAI